MKRVLNYLIGLAVIVITIFGFSANAQAVTSETFLYCSSHATMPSVSIPTTVEQVVSVEYHNPDSSKSGHNMGAVFSKHPHTTAGGYKDLGPVVETIKPGESVFISDKSAGYPYVNFLYDPFASDACIRVSVTVSPEA